MNEKLPSKYRKKKNFRTCLLNGIGHIVSVDKIGFEEIKIKRLRGDLILISQRSVFFFKILIMSYR